MVIILKMVTYTQSEQAKNGMGQNKTYHKAIKGAVSRQSFSFCLILPITRPQSLRNLKQAKKLHVNDKIRDPRQTNMSPEHYF